mmetsp:Transcript_13542/g.13610  ORF Transcript_13542/g.13610 Transcript_13542/m.13610 type:complete len:128 (-) Transcript_13542:345-728(-)
MISGRGLKLCNHIRHYPGINKCIKERERERKREREKAVEVLFDLISTPNEVNALPLRYWLHIIDLISVSLSSSLSSSHSSARERLDPSLYRNLSLSLSSSLPIISVAVVSLLSISLSFFLSFSTGIV